MSYINNKIEATLKELSINYVKLVIHDENFNIIKLRLVKPDDTSVLNKTERYMQFSEVKQLALAIMPKKIKIEFRNVLIWAEETGDGTVKFYWGGKVNVHYSTFVDILGNPMNVNLTTSMLDRSIKHPLEVKYGYYGLQLKTLYTLEYKSQQFLIITKAEFNVVDTNEIITLTSKEIIKALSYELSTPFKTTTRLNKFFKGSSIVYYDTGSEGENLEGVNVEIDKDMSDWINRSAIINKTKDYVIMNGRLIAYKGNEKIISLPPVYDIEKDAFRRTPVEEVKLPSTFIKHIRFSEGAIDNEMFNILASMKYTNRSNEIVKFDESNTKEFYENMQNTSDFKKLMMLIRYKSLDVTYYDSLYLSSKDIIRVEI